MNVAMSAGWDALRCAMRHMPGRSCCNGGNSAAQLHVGCVLNCRSPSPTHPVLRFARVYAPAPLPAAPAFHVQLPFMSVVLAPRIASEAGQAALETLACDDPLVPALALEAARRGQEQPDAGERSSAAICAPVLPFHAPLSPSK